MSELCTLILNTKTPIFPFRILKAKPIPGQYSGSRQFNRFKFIYFYLGPKQIVRERFKRKAANGLRESLSNKIPREKLVPETRKCRFKRKPDRGEKVTAYHANNQAENFLNIIEKHFPAYFLIIYSSS